MERTFVYTIPTEYDGKKICDFLRDKGFSRQNLTDIRFKNYGLFVQGEKVFRNHILRTDDELRVEINEQENSSNIPPVNIPIDIVYEDEDILVVNKPWDMPVHPSLNNYENSLGNAVMYYYNSRGIDFVYRCINRLDRDTSGLVLIAKNIISANILGQLQKSMGIHKEYLAIVCGEFECKEGTVNLPIGRAEGSTIERRIDYDGGKEAVTHYRVIKSFDNKSLVSLKLDTGRTHQIRVHMKAIGHPLVGDFLYNPENYEMKRQALHVSRLEFVHPITGEKMIFESNLPDDMKELDMFLITENKRRN